MANGLRREAFNQSSYDFWTGKYGIVNVKDFGAVGDGVHDDTAAIQAAIASIADVGGIVFLPSGKYAISSTLILGNGTTTSVSTQNGISVRGASAYSTSIEWVGAAGGQIAAIAGICQGNSFGDLTMDGKNIAEKGLEIVSGQYAQWEQLLIRNCDICLKLNTLSAVPSGQTGNCIGNKFEKLNIYPNAGTAITQTYGLWLDGFGAVGDSNNNDFPNTHILAEASYTTALRLGFCDFNSFGVMNVFGAIGLTNMYGLHIDGTVVANFPGANRFKMANFAGPILQSGTPGVNYVEFFDAADGETTVPSVSGLAGVSQNPLGGTNPVGFGAGAPVLAQVEMINFELTTTGSTQIVGVASALDGLYLATLYLRVLTAATVVTAIAYTGDETGTAYYYAQAQLSGGTAGTVLNAASLTVGSYVCVPIPLRYAAGATQKPSIYVTAGTANQVYASASIVKLA